jgi:hypothetical protein
MIALLQLHSAAVAALGSLLPLVTLVGKQLSATTARSSKAAAA